MCDIIALDEQQPHMTVIDRSAKAVRVIAISTVRRIASGEVSIAEMDDPEGLARCMAIALMEKL